MNLKPEELVKALRCCKDGDCWCLRLYNDAQRCQETLLGSAAELIERMGTDWNGKERTKNDL